MLNKSANSTRIDSKRGIAIEQTHDKLKETRTTLCLKPFILSVPTRMYTNSTDSQMLTTSRTAARLASTPGQAAPLFQFPSS